MTELIIKGLWETIFMIIASGVIGAILGIPIAILLFISGDNGLSKAAWVYHALSFAINSARSIPYIILIVLLIPVSRALTGSSIGMYSATIPLSFAAMLLIAKTVEEALRTNHHGLIEAGIAMGASNFQIIWKILIPESLPNIVSGLTIVMVNLVGFSAMAGAVGGGGLGDLAIRYGYQRYNLEVLAIIVLILIALVQTLQLTGNYFAKLTKK